MAASWNFAGSRKGNNEMHKPNHPTRRLRRRQIMGILAIAAMWPAQALAQSSPTTEYIRAGGRLIAVLHMPPAYFTDLSGQPYANDANLLHDEGISSGCQASPPLFCPASGLTRDEMAVFIVASVYAALQGPGQVAPVGGWPSLPQYFTDVPPSNPYYHWIEQMKYLNITGGCQASPPMYCPTSPTTNGEMAVFTMAAREYVLTGNALTAFPYPTTPQCFPDVASTDVYFKFVQGLAQLNVIPYGGWGACPSSTQFLEGNAITRIQAAPYAVRGILGDQSY